MIWKINPLQRQRVNSLVRRLCSCYNGGNCILLDDGEPHRCVQLISRSGITCRHFKRTVLPADRELYDQLKRYNRKGVRGIKISGGDTV